LEDNGLNSYPLKDIKGNRVGGYYKGDPSIHPGSNVILPENLLNWSIGMPVPVITG
jgi:hypothetical protein